MSGEERGERSGGRVRRFVTRFLIGTAFGGLFLAFAWRQVRQDLAEAGVTDVGAALWEAVGTASLSNVLVYALLFGVCHVAKVWRWMVQVEPLGAPLGAQTFRIGSVGLAAVIALPLRLGELLRPALLARETDVTYSAAMGVSVVERIVDGWVLTLLLFVTLWMIPADQGGLVRHAAWVCLGLFSAGSVSMALFVRRRAWTLRLLEATVGRWSARVAEGIERIVDGFALGVSSLWRSGRLAAFLVATVVSWGFNILALWQLGLAYGFALGWVGASGVLAMVIVGTLLPSGPGYFGNFQFFLYEGMRFFLPGVLLGASALAFALVLNLVQVGVPLLLAAITMLLAGVTPRGLLRAARQEMLRRRRA